MPDLEYPRSAVREIEDIEDTLRTALGAAYLGASRSGRALIIHLAEGADIAAAEAAIDAAIAGIDRGQPPPSVRRALTLTAARQGLDAADFAALHSAINDVANVAALKPVLLALLRLLWQIARVQGLTDKDDPGA
jgi:hypothetical protein